jgi:hypothetical protein
MASSSIWMTSSHNKEYFHYIQKLEIMTVTSDKRSRCTVTSFPLVSPLSNHSTVTLRVVVLIPDTTAE